MVGLGDSVSCEGRALLKEVRNYEKISSLLKFFWELTIDLTFENFVVYTLGGVNGGCKGEDSGISWHRAQR